MHSKVYMLPYDRSGLFWMDNVIQKLFPASHPNNLNDHGRCPHIRCAKVTKNIMEKVINQFEAFNKATYNVSQGFLHQKQP